MSTTPLPQWTAELTETFVVGEDQLGVEGAAQGYQQYLVPGVITSTDHARYYSFYAWVLYRFITQSDSSRLLEDFKGTFYRRHEMAFLLAAYSHHRDGKHLRGLTGAGNRSYKVRGYWDSGDPVSLDRNYFGNKLGGFGQYYRPVMETMGILAPAEHPKWVYRLTHQGEKLAQAYEESIAGTGYSRALSGNSTLATLSHQDAEEYGQSGCLCAESLAGSKELELLRDAFFRFDQTEDDTRHVNRRKSLGVALDLVHNAEGTFTDSMLVPALYLGEYESDRLYIPTAPIHSWAQRWRMVEVRHFYTFGLQCLWAAFLIRLSEQPHGITFGAYMEWVKQQLEVEVWDTEANAFLDNLVKEVGLEAPWISAHPVFGDACLQDTDQDEYSLYLFARQNREDPEILVGAGLLILSKLYLRFLSWRESDSMEWSELATRERLPLQTYMDECTENLGRGGWTIGDWLTWLYRDYVLGQHEFIALQKLRYQHYDTFKFYYGEGVFLWPFASQTAYREPIRIATNRLYNILSILVDLGLVNRNDDRYQLSDEGESYWLRTLGALNHV